jgi:hypothetical protein
MHNVLLAPSAMLEFVHRSAPVTVIAMANSYVFKVYVNQHVKLIQAAQTSNIV